MLILALDYKRTQNPLTCSMDGRNMEALARACGVTDVTAMYDEQCTKEQARDAIQAVGERCGEDDYFVIYYSGHGTSVDDEDGDEEDGKDEALCFVDEQGQISYETCMTDDDFAEAIVNATEDKARIIILTDCCHSGTIADLDKDIWEDREVISIAGCLDSQTSGDMGKGGIFTHSLLLAIDQLAEAEQEDYSCGMIYNATLNNDNKIFNSAQDITIQSSSATAPDRMAWPLMPADGVDYRAPLSQASQASSGTPGGAPGVGGMDPGMLAQLGLSPQIASLVQDSGLMQGQFDAEKLLTAGAQAGLQMLLSGQCNKDACAIM